jgi:hypothetical protein
MGIILGLIDVNANGRFYRKENNIRLALEC